METGCSPSIKSCDPDMPNATSSSLPSAFIQPEYGRACFADLPLLTHSLLAGIPEQIQHLDPSLTFREQYDFVILLFLDSFGWRYFEKFRAHPFLQRFASGNLGSTQSPSSHSQSGNPTHQVAKWTSQFPSTTAAHVTAIHTGLPVGQSGLYEWIYYEPDVDAIIAPLLFSHAGTKDRDSLFDAGVKPTDIYPSKMTHYERLQQSNISSTILQHTEYTPSTYSDVVFRGAEVIPYRTLPEALSTLRLHLAQASPPHYYFLYFDKIDSIGHDYGPNSVQVEAEIEAALTSLERTFVEKIEAVTPKGRKGHRGLMIVTADHGMAEVDPETVTYLNTEPQLASIQPTFRKDGSGQPIVPAGSPRDMFLYIEDASLESVYQQLSGELEPIAAVAKTADLVARGYFGPEPMSPQFLARLGNLVILPYLHQSVWWYEPGKFVMDKLGHHGGLTPEEAHIPLLTVELEL